MSSKTKTLKVLAELYFGNILETGETKTHPIRFIFDESPTKTCADLQAYVLSRYASKYGPLRVTDIEVLDTDFATPVYVVADDELVLEDGKRFRIRAAPIGKENRPSTGNASKDHPRAAKPVASAKTAVSCRVPSLVRLVVALQWNNLFTWRSANADFKIYKLSA